LSDAAGGAPVSLHAHDGPDARFRQVDRLAHAPPRQHGTARIAFIDDPDDDRIELIDLDTRG
jgi:hypothetical protein